MIKGYSRKEAREYTDEGSWLARHLIWKIVGLMVLLAVIGFGLNLLFTPFALVGKGTDPDHIINNYEEFQNMYNACVKLNTDLGTIRAVPKDDPMFAQFSKSAMIVQKKQLLNRWVEEYNAKSKMINRNLWKSHALPYQLSVDDFSNYEGAIQ